MLPLSEGQSQHFHQTGKSEEIFFDEQPFWGIVTNEEVRAPGASSIGVRREIARQDFADCFSRLLELGCEDKLYSV